MTSSIPTTMDEILRTQSVTSVDANYCGIGNGCHNSNVAGGSSSAVKEARSNVPRSSSSSRPILPYVTHYSDSGFSSTLSSGSSCSYLPPPPPYRVRSGTTNSDGADRLAAVALVEDLTRRQQRRIHRSLSDSKYGTSIMHSITTGSHRLSQHAVRESQPKPSISSQSFATPVGPSKATEQYRSNRDSSWIASRLSLSPSPSMSTVSCPEYPELQEKLHRLAMARDSLSLQVTVLNEQVDAQKEKIRDLENMLATKRKRFSYEMLSEPSIEAQTSNLINEIADLKAKYTELERDKLSAERRLQLSQAEIDRLGQAMHQLMTQQNVSFPSPVLPPPAADPGVEMEQLRITVQRLIADNEQKSQEINNLKNALDEHSRAIENYTLNSQRSSTSHGNPPGPAPPLNFNAQLRKLLIDDSKENITHSNSFPASLCSGSQQSSAYCSMSARTPVQPSTSYTSSLSIVSPQPSSWSSGISAAPRHVHNTASAGAPAAQQAALGFRSPSSPAARQLAAELDELRRINGELSLQQTQQNYSSNSLPRQLAQKSNSTLTLPRQKLTGTASSTNGSVNGEYGSIAHPPSGRSLLNSKFSGLTASTGRLNPIKGWIQKNILNRTSGRRRRTPTTRPPVWRNGGVYGADDAPETFAGVTKRSTSAPNLVASDDELARSPQAPMTSSTSSHFKRGGTRHTLRNIIGKLTRSTSQEMSGSVLRRGSGIRASASARLANFTPTPYITGALTIRPPVQQFVDWTTDQLCEWFTEIGFAQYVPDVERYVRSGRHLLNISDNELEKELGVKNSLHRKRLKCILDCIDKNAAGPADRMDVHQVLLWLDLIGLPQYRDAFSENYIDGQMLLCLTAQDLLDMKIVSALNHATLSRGIEFLYSVDFYLHRLEKHFNPELLQQCPIPNEVERWSHACVSHWLKSIDLAEFTPNLIFSGIHGALMVHEPAFTAESLAEVLQIPVHKTLLRRHLTTQFNNLIGQDIISYKRETCSQPFIAFLAPALRVKLVKKGFSLTRKKNKNEVFVEPNTPVFTPKPKHQTTAIPAPLNTDI